MAARYDVAARLAEGREAIEEIGGYVWAAHLRGFQHPDLTLHPGQVRDWYATEDGLDLAALDADCATLRALGERAAEALRDGGEQRRALAAAWAGGSGGAAQGFLDRHLAAAELVCGRLRGALRCYGGLRDRLWEAVDAKVSAVAAVLGAAAGRRADWRAASAAVIAGGTDEAVLRTVDDEVKPFVVQHVCGEWLSAMRTALGAVDEACRGAAAELAAAPPAFFEVPGDLVPPPPMALAGPGMAPPAGSAAGAPPPGEPLGAPPLGAEPVPPPTTAPTTPPATVPAAAAVPPPAPDPGFAAPPSPAGSGGSPLPGLGIPDLGIPDFGVPESGSPDFGALEDVGPVDEPGPDANEAEPEDAEPEEAEPEEAEPEDAEPEDAEPEDADDPGPDDADPEDPDADDSEPADPDAADPESAAEPVLAEPEVTADPPATPCEIAADALPQVGA
ncbi:hypothetical protein [Mycolicibacterium fallax]|uniref:Uncharacterized protein n=1 Tax=Mycolicibacterium fallax TaxID=1793 RepID=A0A1X1RLJ7_MYCFA|nr:hypothetical protein [Mycolicibacterium fallax]ORV09145.1 hypothetical protein AWC04_01550 [Mycolicibacterium fallax]BBY98571.1 hypothetical protein MFAL_20380 [Mycolicibacterium fallax]